MRTIRFASLDRFDRHNVVHLSSNFQLEDSTIPATVRAAPLDVDLLALTSAARGSIHAGRGHFHSRKLSVEWRHRATVGRDHYVRVVTPGSVPFGHRVSLVKIAERQFHQELSGNPAYLRRRMFLIVREPLDLSRPA
jgi:hypothetical protein